MKVRVLVVLVIVFFSGFVSAQSSCVECSSDMLSDYCFKDEIFHEHCAMFMDGEATFRLKVGKKVKTIPLKSISDTKGLVEIATNRKLKISAVDMLFIQAALKTWEVESRKIGFEDQPSGLGIKILKAGTGDLPKKGKEVTVHYTGWLLDGTKFDSSVDRGTPFKFVLGQGRVIKGWDEGVSKMKRGTKVLLKIPADLGYGSRGSGRVIPPNSTLIFEIELFE
jgi:FKBP-type peptidyl-prolyl cis-trans isomerase